MNHADIDQIHEIVFRLGLATVLGIILGIDRDLHRKPAGLRVLAMVALGSCGIIMASMMSVESTADAMLRTAQGVLSGIGFIGAGVIIHAQGKDEVHGITTASSIWISAIIGMICGTGQWMLAISIFVIAWMLLLGGGWMEWQITRWAATKNAASEKPVAGKEEHVESTAGI